MSETIITLPLLHLLEGANRQTISRGELRVKGISDEMIIEAERLGQVIIGASANARNGEMSLLATVSLTDEGEYTLDDADTE